VILLEKWKEFFNEIKKNYKKGTEHTHRTAFHNLCTEIKPNKRIEVIHEPKRESGFGAPDFKIEKNGAIIGYFETKPLGENLDKILKSDQIKKYLSLKLPLLLTNYSEYILLIDGAINSRATLFYLTDLENKKTQIQKANVEQVSKLFELFFISEPLKIGDAKELAVQLADRAKIVKEFIYDTLDESKSTEFNDKVKGLYSAFKDTLVADLDKEEFSDAYAQTVVYGFFLAFLESGKKITINDASRLIPNSFKVIREFFNLINDLFLPSHIEWIFNEIINLINNVDLDGIYKSISFNKKEFYQGHDPYIYFYENFLSEFDAQKRKSKGVYYTPIQVVQFITKSIESILKDKFGKQNGFADSNVTLLDFASGTGTFLVSIFELILEHTKGNKGRTKKLIQEHILRNFYGFEYLVAPYAISHLKLAQLLKNEGYDLSDKDRIQIYLTDTLDNTEHRAISLMPHLTKEGKEANYIKTQKPILVITGNPPYNNKSRNNKDWIRSLIQSYKPADEKKLNLDDDYIKFIRFAHLKISENKSGIVGIITNNSFLNGITHRKMRNELLREFDEIYILNLHGNSWLGERAPDGSNDDNVFDIQQGVAISIFIKSNDNQTDPKVYYYDLYGSRNHKYSFLNNNSVSNIDWELIDYLSFNKEFNKTRWGNRFQDDLSFFTPIKDTSKIKTYGEFWGITDIFKHYNSGIQTKRDKFTLHFCKNDLEDTISDLRNLNDEEILEKYSLPNDGRDWTIEKARISISTENYNEENIKKMIYRPFDERITYLNEKSKGYLAYPRYGTMKHIAKHNNYGFIFMRQADKNAYYNHFLVTDKIVDHHLFRSFEGTNYIAPLYLYEEESKEDKLFNGDLLKIENFSEAFRKFFNANYKQDHTPEEILGYIYSISYSDIFRTNFEEYLVIDFPRIPFFKSDKLFNSLSKLGSELIDVHTFNKSPHKLKINYPKKGNDEIESPSFTSEGNSIIGNININKEQYFENVPLSVWEYEIGGYPVIKTWLDYRKGRELSNVDQEYIIHLCDIILFTIEQTKKIDKVLREYLKGN
jgi:predicted helicase